MQAHHVGLVGVLELHLAREIGEEPGQKVVGDDRRAAPLAHRVGEPDVVVVLVGEDHLLDVLEPQSARCKRRLELDHGLGPVSARVDQGQGIALEQIAVDGPNGERHGQRDRGDGHLTGFYGMDYLPTVW